MLSGSFINFNKGEFQREMFKIRRDSKAVATNMKLSSVFFRHHKEHFNS